MGEAAGKKATTARERGPFESMGPIEAIGPKYWRVRRCRLWRPPLVWPLHARHLAPNLLERSWP